MHMESGDRKEWFWSDYNQERLISVRKTGYDEDSYMMQSSSEHSASDDEDDVVERKHGDITEESIRRFQVDESSQEEDDSDDEESLKRSAGKKVGFTPQKHRSERFHYEVSDQDEDD